MSPATEHPTHRSPSRSLAPTEHSCWPAVTQTASKRVGLPSVSMVSVNASTSRPTHCQPLRSTWLRYRALARDFSSGEHTTPDFDHAVRLTHLLDDVYRQLIPVTASHGRTGLSATPDLAGRSATTCKRSPTTSMRSDSAATTLRRCDYRPMACSSYARMSACQSSLHLVERLLLL
jgi:hypothetical protein